LLLDAVEFEIVEGPEQVLDCHSRPKNDAPFLDRPPERRLIDVLAKRAVAFLIVTLPRNADAQTIVNGLPEPAPVALEILNAVLQPSPDPLAILIARGGLVRVAGTRSSIPFGRAAAVRIFAGRVVLTAPGGGLQLGIGVVSRASTAAWSPSSTSLLR
jgi:hypothetical protein